MTPAARASRMLHAEENLPGRGARRRTVRVAACRRARGACAPATGPSCAGPTATASRVETGLIDTWKLNGENFLWRVPYGGRSAPIVMGNRVYVQNPSGRGAHLQERVHGARRRHRQGRLGIQVQPLPERRAAAPHRLGVAGRRSRDRQHLRAERRRAGHRAQPRRQAALGALVRRGVRRLHDARRPHDVAGRRRRSGDRQRRGLELGNGRRTARIASSPSTSGPARSSTSSNPGGRPYDTAYASPLIATINGMRLLIAGLGDGAIHAIKPQTGEKVWSFAAAKRAINTGVAVSGNTVFVSHGDENLEGNELGLVAAIDGSQTGDIKTTKWADEGHRVRLLVAARRRHAPLSDRQRLDAARLRHRHRARSCGRCRWARRRRRRRCWPTARSTSAPTAACSSSSGRRPTRRRS